LQGAAPIGRKYRTQHAFVVGIGKADFCVFLQDFIGGCLIKTFFSQYGLRTSAYQNKD